MHYSLFLHKVLLFLFNNILIRWVLSQEMFVYVFLFLDITVDHQANIIKINTINCGDKLANNISSFCTNIDNNMINNGNSNTYDSITTSMMINKKNSSSGNIKCYICCFGNNNIDKYCCFSNTTVHEFVVTNMSDNNDDFYCCVSNESDCYPKCCCFSNTTKSTSTNTNTNTQSGTSSYCCCYCYLVNDIIASISQWQVDMIIMVVMVVVAVLYCDDIFKYFQLFIGNVFWLSILVLLLSLAKQVNNHLDFWINVTVTNQRIFIITNIFFILLGILSGVCSCCFVGMVTICCFCVWLSIALVFKTALAFTTALIFAVITVIIWLKLARHGMIGYILFIFEIAFVVFL